MNKKTKIILGVVVLVIIVVLVAVFYKPAPKGTIETIKIGAILPLTGGGAFIGQSTKNAILLAQSQLSKDTRYSYEVIFEDDQMDPVKTSSALNKLINIDGVDAVISITSGPGNVVSPVTQQNKIIHIGIASDPNIAKGDFNFIHWTPPESEAKKLVEEIEKRNIKNLAFIGAQQQGVMATWDLLKKELSESGVNVVAEEWFPFGTRDFKTIILKVKQSKPEIIVIVVFSPELEILAKQMRELKIDTPLTAIEAFEYTEQLELFEGYWYIQAADATDKFTNEYITKYGDNPKLGSPYGYDSFNLIVYGFEQAGKKLQIKPTPESVIQALLSVKDFSGAVGKLMMQSNHIIWSDAAVKQIINGKPEVIK